MSIAALYTSNGDVSASSLDELNNILSDKYDEQGVLIKRLSRRLSCKGPTGVGWFTPDAMLQRLNDHFSRLFEDKGITSPEYKNSFRLYSDIALVVVPQVPSNIDANVELSLVDSALPLDDLGSENVVVVHASDGPVLVLFHTAYSVPNIDRCNFNGSAAHRRLGIRYMVSHNGISSDSNSDVTLFTASASWNRQFSMVPSYYKLSDPTVIPIDVGFHEHSALTHPRLLKQYVKAGLNVKSHLRQEQQVVGTLDIRSEAKPIVSVKDVMTNKQARPLRSISVPKNDPELPNRRHGRNNRAPRLPPSDALPELSNTNVPRPPVPNQIEQ